MYIDNLDTKLCIAQTAIKIRPETRNVLLSPAWHYKACLCILALQVPAVESRVLRPPAHRGWCLLQAPRWGASRPGGLKTVHLPLVAARRRRRFKGEWQSALGVLHVPHHEHEVVLAAALAAAVTLGRSRCSVIAITQEKLYWYHEGLGTGDLGPQVSKDRVKRKVPFVPAVRCNVRTAPRPQGLTPRPNCRLSSLTGPPVNRSAPPCA
jgi:hypothetical protein